MTAKMVSGVRLGLMLWRVQLLIFLNQTVRSRSAGRIAGFVAGVILILFWWLNLGTVTVFVVAAKLPLRPPSLEQLLSLAFLVYTGVLIFSSLLFSLNALLLNPDLDLLLVAPRPVETVLAARMVVQVLRMLVIALLLTFPALVILSVTGLPAVLPGFIVLLTVYPVLPVVVISVATLALVRFIPPGRGKEVITILGVAIGLGVNVINFMFNPAFRGTSSRHVGIGSTAPDVPLASYPFLPSGWAGRAAAGLLTADWGAVFGWGLLLVTASGLVFGAGSFLSGRLYRAGWIQAVTARHRRTTSVRRRGGRMVRGLDPVVAGIVTKDWRMRTRDLAQLARFVMPVLFLLVLVPLRAGGVVSSVRSWGPGPLPALAGLVPSWLLLLSLSSALGLSAVSLEGKAIWIFAASPNQMGRLLYAKCWASALPTVAATVLIAVVMEVLIRPGWPWAFAAIGIIAVQSGAITALMVAIGGFWARFDWTDARRMMHPAALIVGLTAQLGISGATALLAVGSVLLTRLLHTELLTTFFAALLIAALGAVALAFAGLVLATDRLRTIDLP